MPYEEIAVTPNTQQRQNEVAISGDLDATLPSTVLHLASGRSITLPTELLLAGLPERQVRTAADGRLAGESTDTKTYAGAQREQVIPLVEEQAVMGKKTVTTGTVRLQRGTETFTDSVSLPVTRVGWEIERIPIGQLYSERPEIRQDGEETVYPLVEERLVATREYFLIEEVRVRRVATTTERTATVDLKRDVLTVEREGASPVYEGGSGQGNDGSLR